jgi:hypothetical protein
MHEFTSKIACSINRPIYTHRKMYVELWWQVGHFFFFFFFFFQKNIFFFYLGVNMLKDIFLNESR